jgi:hypothetical protein
MNLPEFLTEDTQGFIHLTGHRIGLTHLSITTRATPQKCWPASIPRSPWR